MPHDSHQRCVRIETVIQRFDKRAASWCHVLVVLVGGVLLCRGEPAAWQPVSGTLMTRWASQVNPTNALPEYPRPQLVRKDWLNLNGLWNYAIVPATNPRPTAFEGRILVPFPVESALSGVRRRLDEKSVLWYERKVAVPAAWRGQRIRLHFEAVDWQARVFVNGQEVGQHRGGYDRFGFDITGQLHWNGDEEIIVAVTDPTEGDQPRGKQSRKPEGIFYTPNSGIWQTVWLEPVPKTSVDKLKLTPDLEGRTLRLQVGVNSLADNLRVEAVALVAGQEIGRTAGMANTELFLPVESPRVWTPDDPFLYDLRVTLRENGREVETVSSYFGMRKVSLKKDAQGITRVALNDVFLFQVGTLDQGFWPDGIYTAPTDEALRSDIEFLKRSGFNLTRKHVKVEPDRWYYWCDKLGLLVWQDMPSGNNATPEGRRDFEAELLHLVAGLENHPSIIVWVLFNEGWGQFDTERLTQGLKALDPSRLVNNASGWTDMRAGDLIDVHSYPGPDSPDAEPRRAAVLGEFGGLGFQVVDHSWSSNWWGYLKLPDQKELAGRYAQLLKQVWALHDLRGLSAAIYTQTTDVETECNGLLTYDRAVAKVDQATILAANRGELRGPPMKFVLPDAVFGRTLWRYTTDKPDEDWSKSGFDASAWKEGPGGFGASGTPGSRANTTWKTANIWLRRDFVLETEPATGLTLRVYHDEDAEIYINGVLAAQLEGYNGAYAEVEISAAAAGTLRSGRNTIAVHCRQTGGGQGIDVGILMATPTKPAGPASVK